MYIFLGAAFRVKTSYTKDEVIWEQHQELYKTLDESVCGSHHRTSDKTFRDRQRSSSQKRLLKDTRERPQLDADTPSVRRSYSVILEETNQCPTGELFVRSSATTDCKTKLIQLGKNEFFI